MAQKTITYDDQDWQLVPKVPDENMGKASRLYWRNKSNTPVGAVTQWGINVWDKILAAAPKHPDDK